MMRTYLLAVAFSLFPFLGSILLAQSSKFGKVSLEEFSFRPTGEDSGAAAVILFEGNRIGLRASPESGYKVEYTIHRRILLLNEAAVGEWAELLIPYSRRESVYDIDGATFREQGGEIVRTDLKNNQVFSEVYTSRIGLKKFALPDAVPGSIIEYRYTYTTTNLVALDPILLQHKIPVRLSEHIIELPDKLIYKYLWRCCSERSSFGA